MKKGDTVRFVNAVGGGVISRFDEKKGLVYVEDEDGFEIPVLARECVVVPNVNPTTNFPTRDFSSKAGKAGAGDGMSAGGKVGSGTGSFSENSSFVAGSSARSSSEQGVFAVSGAGIQDSATLSEILSQAQKQVEEYETPTGDQLSVVLAFLPVDRLNLQASDYEAILINDSNYFLMYSVVVGEKDLQRSVAQGVLEPNMQEQIAALTNADLNNWENVRVQALAYKLNKNFAAQGVVDARLRIAPLKFYKLHSFTENDYFDEPAMVFDLIQPTQPAIPEPTPEEIRRALLQKEPTPTAPVRRDKIPLQRDIIEVDLHIHELVDTTTGMSNADMLQLQMDKFHAVIAENSKRKGQKIVFIHGKGEGVLRSEIMKALKNRYKSFYVQDASFKEYGFGATMIRIQ
ncbi:MAG: DUF2027 domain-containing protein [Paludibacter sp.]|jgi:hypothetical protein|nr:DUF2027 domain-containing protein [Paludibacter sp.]